MSANFSQHVHLYSIVSDFPWDIPGNGQNPLADIRSSCFALSFEQATAELEKLPRMFVELDGSFVWTGQEVEQCWQIDGMLYDRAGRMQRVELKGFAPRSAWEPLLAIFDRPLQSLIIHCQIQMQLLRRSEFLARVNSEWSTHVH